MAAEEDVIKELLKEWEVCYSKRKQRDYYFNSRTGEALWTLDEVKEKIKQSLLVKNKTSQSPEKKPKSHNRDEPAAASSGPNTSNTKDKKKKPDLHGVVRQDVASEVEPATSHTSAAFEMQIDPADDYQPQDMDYEIIEINKMRAETTGEASCNIDMDVDMNQIEIDTNALRLIAVLDTNIFISNLAELETIAGKHREDILFTVPWVVLQELDSLKSRNSISDKSKRAIRFIHTILSTKTSSSNFLFENSTQSQTGPNLIKCEKNDDKILNFALKAVSECPGYHVILISNDVNLINKSIISNIEAVNFTSFKNNLAKLIRIENNSSSAVAKPISNSVEEQRFLDESFIRQFFKDLSEIYEKQVNELIVGCLSIFFEHEMKQTYQELWLDLLLHKPPWSLATIIPNLNKCFSALFGFSGKKNSKGQREAFDSLRDKVNLYLNSSPTFSHRRKNQLSTIDNFKLFVKISIDTYSLLDNFDLKKYGPKFNEYYNKLEFFKSNGVKICNVYNLISKFLEIPDAELTNIGVELLEKIWQKYQSMSQLTLDLISKHLSENSNSKSAKADECKLLYEALICAGSIKSFRIFYEKCLDDETRAKTVISLSRTAYVLMKLFNFDNESNQIQLLNVNNELKKFSIIDKTLKNCFADLNNRETMRKGLNQLEEFEGKFESMSLDEFFLFVLNK